MKIETQYQDSFKRNGELITQSYTQYDNTRYIESVDENILNVINSFIDNNIKLNSFEGFKREFYLEIEIKKIKKQPTKIISGEYKGIYFEQYEKIKQ